MSADIDAHTPGYCIICGTALSGGVGVRFCSSDCRKSYQSQVKCRIAGSAENASPGIRELKEMIFQYVEYADSITDERRLEFYENIVEKTALLLKYINDSNASPDDELRRQLRQTQELNHNLQEKLDRLLQKAAELKKENKKLRQDNQQPTAEARQLACKMLGIKEGADIAAIKSAYRQKAKLTHPDNEQGDSDLFKAITDAMIILLANRQNS